MGIDSHRHGARRHRPATGHGPGRSRATPGPGPFTHPTRPVAAPTDAARQPTDHESLSRTGAAALRPRCHGHRSRLVDLAMSDRLTLVLRYADVGIATYA